MRMVHRTEPESIVRNLSPVIPLHNRGSLPARPAIPCIVHMLIPAAEEETLAHPPQSIHNSALSHGRSTVARILIVDDEPAVQVTIRLLLERAGHSVVTAGDGRNGLAIFATEAFDLLFLDIFMPGMDGLEMMRRVREQRPLIPIIVMSGHLMPSDSRSGPDFLNMATRLGAVRSLQKPFKPAEMLAAVAACLEIAEQTTEQTTGRSPAASVTAGGMTS
jgi:CheY-like chemotaxis protein